MIVEKFHPGHLMLGHLDIPVPVEDLQSFGAALGGPYSALADGQLVAVAGLSLLWHGVAEAWLFTTPLLPRYALAATRAISGVVDATAGNYGLHRVQATVSAAQDNANRWVEILGFEHEGRLRRYWQNGEDCNLYARVY